MNTTQSISVNPRSGYIYLFRVDKYYKIGLSGQPGRRYSSIATSVPFPVERVHQFRCWYVSDVEAALHQRFKDKRLNGEWFELSKEDVRGFESLDSDNIYQEVQLMVSIPVKEKVKKPSRQVRKRTPLKIEPQLVFNNTILPLPRAPIPGTKDAGYLPALELVARIDEELTRGVRHYRTKAGLLLTTLDEVVRAVIDGSLAEASRKRG